MRLKRVRLFGFKTFADRAEFALEGGIVAVVGPNGCGKSNLVDAILWGLGEGNSRTLRAATSHDVIFNGAKSRKGVGYCEVSLLFDNDDGALPIDASEVEISRRLTRGGDSTYSINRHTCRLRDVLELLADSGLGRAGYAVVGQREIDAALAASAEERRGWLDEAAGVQRYRARKVESLKRLSSARDHLSRVADLVQELERQEEPLRLESDRARRARLIATELQGIEVGLLARELGAAKRDVEAAAGRGGAARAAVSKAQERAADSEVAALQASERAESFERDAAASRLLVTAATAQRESAEADLRVVTEREAGLDALVQSYRPLAEEAAQAERIEAAAVEVAQSEWDVSRAKLNAIEGTGVEDASRAREANERRTRAEDALSIARSEAERRAKLRATAEAGHIRREMIGKELEAALLEASRWEREVAETVERFEESSENVLKARAALDGTKNPTHGLREKESAQILREAERTASAAEASARAIAGSLEAAEGASQGARAVLDLIRRGELTFEATLVGTSAKVGSELAVAIETALGGAASDLIVDRDADAQAAIRVLKERRLGRATFQPLDLVRGTEGTIAPREAGVVGVASELVEVEAAYRPVFRSLLGKVLIVENLDVAIRFARRGGGWSRIVTLDGEVVSSRGAVTGGIAARRGSGLVARRTELAEAEQGAEKAQRAFQTARWQLEEAQKWADSGRVNEEAAAVALRETESRAHEARRNLEEARRAFSAVGSKIEALRRQMPDEVEVAIEGEIDLAALEAEREVAMEAALTAEGASRESAERMVAFRDEVRRRGVEAEAANRRFTAARESTKRLIARVEGIEPERERLKLQAEEAGTRQTAGIAAFEQATEELARAEEARRTAQTAALQAAGEAKTARIEAGVQSEALHEAELARTRAETKRAVAAERLMDVYGLSESDALAQEELHEVPKEAAQVVARLRRELKAMGEVSYGAIEAFEVLAHRLGELRGQSADVEASLVEIEAGIAELDGLTRGKFLATFEAVAEAFKEEFESMFGGGAGELRLTLPDNVLESGVEVDVQLPGKRKQPLPLLSGGERSLCAIAFLFSLLRVRPSPLVVLDEVDAPLDGRNVERFASSLVRMAESLQFVVITHNPATIEVAPTWLGVTMQEPGVSTLVPARLGTTKGVLRAAV